MRFFRYAAVALLIAVAAATPVAAQEYSSVVEQAWRAHQEGDHVHAIPLWDSALLEDPGNVVVRTNLARCLIEARDLDRAEEQLTLVFEREPNRPSAHNLMGRVHRLRGDFDAALEEFQRAISGAPQQAWYHNNLGLTLIDLGQYEEAIPPLRAAISLDPDQPVIWNNLGVARMHRGDLAGARGAFERASALDPSFEKARRNLTAVAARASEAAPDDPE